MSEDLPKADLETEERHEFMRALLRDVRALERMLDEGHFETDVRRIGAEQEMFLVDDNSHRPANVNLDVLETIDDERFVTELGMFNMEFNAAPMMFEDGCLRQLEQQLEECLGISREAAREHDAKPILTGILPTIQKSDLSLENMTPRDRYRALNEAMTKLRGTAYDFHIKGIDEFNIKHDSVMLESANTSFQVHFQVEPDEFARLYNIAQVAAAPVLAAATHSPMLFGKRLWHETRIALFQQSVDTRTTDHHHRELEPRVTFGSQWIEDSVLEIYREDIARFRLLFGIEVDEDPIEELDAGRVPSLEALCLHNGTVYRWNRACYGISDGKPHLRIENRVFPSGPTPVDEVANAAFWFGLMSGLMDEHDDLKNDMEFSTAKTNFFSAAREGLAAPMTWFDGHTSPAGELIQNQLLPLAADGLEQSGINSQDIERYLGIIDRRIREKQTGSKWILDSFQEMSDERGLAERVAALTAGEIERQDTGKPVHEWDLATLDDTEADWEEHHIRVGQYMRTDFFTVNEDEIIDLVANVMDWQHIRHVPVEDNEHRLVGLVTHRTLLRLLPNALSEEDDEESIPVSNVMIPASKLVTVEPDTTTLEAIRRMRDEGVSALPVVDDKESNHLVGMVTEREFMNITRELLTKRLESADNQE
jgi:CBS domain-containing protein/gamma-glutamyl:cysteine ligase YbdK (ATP-grasp superfamily)